MIQQGTSLLLATCFFMSQAYAASAPSNIQAALASAFSQVLGTQNSIFNVQYFPTQASLQPIIGNSPNTAYFNNFVGNIEFIIHSAFSSLSQAGVLSSGRFDASRLTPQQKTYMAKTFSADVNLINAQLQALSNVQPASNGDSTILSYLMNVGKKVQADANQISSAFVRSGGGDKKFVRQVKNNANAANKARTQVQQALGRAFESVDPTPTPAQRAQAGQALEETFEKLGL